MSTSESSNSITDVWKSYMWLGAGGGLLVTILILLIVTGLVLWRAVDLIEAQNRNNYEFTFLSIGLIAFTLIRLLAVLIGAAIAFAGLALSFFVHEKATKFGGVINTPESMIVKATESMAEIVTEPTAAKKPESSMVKATLATYSPGIIGMVVGAVIIVCALFAKSEHEYRTPSQYTIKTTSKPVNKPTDVESKLKLNESPMKSSDQILGTSASESNY